MYEYIHRTPKHKYDDILGAENLCVVDDFYVKTL